MTAVPAVSRPGRMVTLLAIRQTYRGALIVAIVAAGMSAIVAGQYQTTFADALSGNALRALADNPAIRVLFGPPVALDDPGGFTVWRTGTAVMVLVAAWALLTATRLTRGDEDAGRTDLLLAGRLALVDLVVRRLVVVSVGTAVVGVTVTLALLASGTTSAGAVIHGACVTGAGLVFTAVGVLAAQIMPSRPAASGLAAGLLAAALLGRMLADGVDQLAWLAWFTPFGLAGKAAPYASDRIVPILVLALTALAVACIAVVTARLRDTGHGLLRLSTSRPPRTTLLGSLTGFAVRRAIGPTVGWTLAVTVYVLLIGTLISSITRFLADNPRFAELAATAGFAGLGSPTGFAAAMFSLLAIPVGLFAASRLAAVTTDETAGRTTSLLALPVSRARHASIEVTITAGAMIVPLAGAALVLWLGATIANAPLRLGQALAGPAKAAPLAWLSLGAAALAHGWAPRAVLAIGAIPTAGGFLFHVIAQSTHAPAWLAAVTPYAHLAAVPDAPPDWTATITVTCIALLMIAVGILGYTRRDLKG
jgi:ABC-2 type transport system permease protein